MYGKNVWWELYGRHSLECGEWYDLYDCDFYGYFLFVDEILLQAFVSDTKHLNFPPIDIFALCAVFLFPMKPSWGDSYFYYGIFFIAIFSVLALDLNSEGFRCLSILSQEDARLTDPSLRVLEWNCFIVTNSYVYSLFGIAIGGVLLFIWYRKSVNQGQ